MQKVIILLIFAMLGFAQMQWDIETVDSAPDTGSVNFNYLWCSMAMDTCMIPHIVYYKANAIFHAARSETGWQKEVVDSEALYTCFSFEFDKNNVGHLSYYRKNDSLNVTYLCYAQLDNNNWTINIVDSISNILSSYWFVWYYKTSLDIDKNGLVGISYTSWVLSDSVHYIKYAHFNGSVWVVSTVEYDSSWTNTVPSDWPSSLKFDSTGTPWIAFYHSPGHQDDTIKLACYDDTLGAWIKSPVICNPGTFIAVSLCIDGNNEPCLAHGLGPDLSYTYRTDSVWYTECITDISLYQAEVELALDTNNTPHIVFHGDFITPSPDYCYRDTIWHVFMQFDPVGHAWGDMELALDDLGQPHVCYTFRFGDRGVRYAKGTLVGIEEETRHQHSQERIQLFIKPSILYNKGIILFNLSKSGFAKISMFDTKGDEIQTIVDSEFKTGCYQVEFDSREFAAGVYFLRLEISGETKIEKVLIVR